MRRSWGLGPTRNQLRLLLLLLLLLRLLLLLTHKRLALEHKTAIVKDVLPEALDQSIRILSWPCTFFELA